MSYINHIETGGKMSGKKQISQWKATEQQYQHLADMAEKSNTSITGYLKQLVNEDMRKKK